MYDKEKYIASSNNAFVGGTGGREQNSPSHSLPPPSPLWSVTVAKETTLNT